MKTSEKRRQTIQSVFNIHFAAGLRRADIDCGVNGGFINCFSLTAFSCWAVPCCVVKLTYLSEAISHWRLHWPEPLLDYRVTLAWLRPGSLANACDGANVGNADKEELLVCMCMRVCMCARIQDVHIKWPLDCIEHLYYTLKNVYDTIRMCLL